MKVNTEHVIEIIRDELCIDDDVNITKDTKLRQELEMDSLDTVTLITALEKAYDITEEMSYSNLVTVSDVVDTIKQYIEKN